MGIVFSLLTGLVVLALPIVVIAALVSRVNRSGEDDEPADDGIGTVRRLFLYGMAAVSLALAASGLALLLGGAIDALFGDLVVAESDTELAVSLSLTVVGLPAWLVFAWLAQRSLDSHPVEARSTTRWWYLALARGVALIVASVFAIAVGRQIVAAADFNGSHWGWFLVASAVWGAHQFEATHRRPPSTATQSIDRIYRAFATGFGLAVLATGLVMVVTEASLQLYDAVLRPTIFDEGQWDRTLRWGVVQSVVGFVVWWWHWIRGLRHEVTTMSWHVVVFLFGILSGLAVAVTTAAAVLYLTLEWALGIATRDAAEHFADAADAFGPFLVGLAALVYHRLVLAERADAVVRSDPERVYRYLVAAAGLLALAGALASSIALALDALLPTGDVIRDAEWWRNDLAVTLTLFAVGAPLWIRYWFASQRVAGSVGVRDELSSGGSSAADATAERHALPRRVFLFAIFGVGVLVLLVNLAILLFQVFDALLEGTFSASTVRDVRWSVALLVSAGAVSAYYWLVLRDDQAAAPVPFAAPPATALREAVIVGPQSALVALRRPLEDAGVRVRAWRRTDADPESDAAEWDEAAVGILLERLRVSEHARVMVLLGTDGSVEVVPFEVQA